MAYSFRTCMLSICCVSLLTLVGCTQTAYVNHEHVIEATAVKEQLATPGVVIIDARTAEDYAKGHVHGAIHLTPQELSIAEPVAGLIAPKNKIEQVLTAKGIHPSDSIYVYDNAAGVSAGRIWWVLTYYGHDKIAIINGGETAILRANLPLSTEVPSLPPSTYTITTQRENWIATDQDVLDSLETPDAVCLLDVRTQPEYDEGHIPGATLFPHTKIYYNDGTLRSPRDLALGFRDIGLKEDDAIILYCKTSFRATPVALALEVAGFTNVRVYDGAWVEWVYKGHPVEAPAGAVVPTGGDGS